MLANAGFLLVAVGVSIVASLLLWLRHRKPSSLSSSVDEFQREMSALGRQPGGRQSERRWMQRLPGGSTRRPAEDPSSEGR